MLHVQISLVVFGISSFFVPFELIISTMPESGAYLRKISTNKNLLNAAHKYRMLHWRSEYFNWHFWWQIKCDLFNGHSDYFWIIFLWFFSAWVHNLISTRKSCNLHYSQFDCRQIQPYSLEVCKLTTNSCSERMCQICLFLMTMMTHWVSISQLFTISITLATRSKQFYNCRSRIWYSILSFRRILLLAVGQTS